jgi:hypothetical protein
MICGNNYDGMILVPNTVHSAHCKTIEQLKHNQQDSQDEDTKVPETKSFIASTGIPTLESRLP